MGPDTSSEVLRQRARCTRCRARGATLMHPSFGGEHIGLALFPAERLAHVGRTARGGRAAGPLKC
jgi:hypothetical protein